MSPIPFSWYSEYLTKEALEGFRDFKSRGQVLGTVKYAKTLLYWLKKKRCCRASGID